MSKKHTVRKGDCINSIAFRYGFFPDTVWSHPENRELKELRKADNVLLEGDVVIIPDLQIREESGPTEQRHRFKRKGVPAVLRIDFVRRAKPANDETGSDGGSYDRSVYEDPGPPEQEPGYEPLANAPYTISGDITGEGTSDGNGRVEIPIRPDAAHATIVFHEGTEDQVIFELALGNLDPVDTPAGLSQRLSNLNYNCPPKVRAIDETVRSALKQFQKEHDIDPTGEPDRATQDKLVAVHGS